MVEKKLNGTVIVTYRMQCTLLYV